jgi:hypothetical protein
MKKMFAIIMKKMFAPSYKFTAPSQFLKPNPLFNFKTRKIVIEEVDLNLKTVKGLQTHSLPLD